MIKRLLLLLILETAILAGCEMDHSEIHNRMNTKYEIRIGTAIDTSRGTVYIRLTDSFCEVTYYRFSDSSYVIKYVPSVPDIVSVMSLK